MQINIQTQVTGGHLLLYVISSSNITILSLSDNDQQSKMLVPGKTYRLEWHTWGPGTATYSIDASLMPAGADPNLPLHFQKTYTGPNMDMGGFFFAA